MRITCLLLGLLILSACNSNELSGAEIPLTIVPSSQIASPLPSATKRSTPPPANNLPNLRVISARNTLMPSNCLLEAPFSSKHVIMVQFTNDGVANAESFTIRINGKDDGDFQQMGAGTIWTHEVLLDGAGEIIVELDPLSQVAESNENDNSFNGLVMTFTPPPHCTVTPSMTPT